MTQGPDDPVLKELQRVAKVTGQPIGRLVADVNALQSSCAWVAPLNCAAGQHCQDMQECLGWCKPLVLAEPQER